MKQSMALLIIFLLAVPLTSQAAEPEWWTRQKQKCGLSSSLSYNTWVSQGSQCNSGGGTSGGFTPEQELGKAIGEALGQAIGEAIRGNPEAEARRKAEAEAEHRRVEEEIRQRDEERKNRLLGGMIGIEDSSALGLLGVESGPELSLMTGDQAQPPATAPPQKSALSAQQAVAGKQVQALSCAISEFQELANDMGEEGAQLRAELEDFLVDLRAELSQPCSGRPVTHKVQTINLSSLTKSAMKEDQLVGSLLMTRDEQSCEVHLDVQHASSRPGVSTRSSGQAGNEGQSLMQIDKSGNILAAETPAGVAACLAQLAR